MQNREELRQKGHHKTKKRVARGGKNINFGRGGGIKHRLWTKM
jgi:hypothetical protein